MTISCPAGRPGAQSATAEKCCQMATGIPAGSLGAVVGAAHAGEDGGCAGPEQGLEGIGGDSGLHVGASGQGRKGEPGQRAGGDDRDDADLVAPQGQEGGEGDEEREPLQPPRERRRLGRLRPQHMPGEEDRQVDDHTDDGGGDAGERRRELQVVPGRLYHRGAHQDEEEGG